MEIHGGCSGCVSRVEFKVGIQGVGSGRGSEWVFRVGVHHSRWLFMVGIPGSEWHSGCRFRVGFRLGFTVQCGGSECG